MAKRLTVNELNTKLEALLAQLRAIEAALIAQVEHVAKKYEKRP
jgi:hypothetical protein